MPAFIRRFNMNIKQSFPSFISSTAVSPCLKIGMDIALLHLPTFTALRPAQIAILLPDQPEIT
jgi:hypothetical protein